MMYELNYEKADHLLQNLKEKYRVYAPKRLAKHGWKTGSDLIRYGEIASFNEIVHDEQSHFSPKDVISPMVQTMMYFTDDKCIDSEIDDKGIILFARPCDINGIKRLDKIFLENGGNEDLYYKRMREKLRIIMLECCEGWDNCFCVSMGTNKSDSYDIAVRFEENKILAEVKADDFKDYFINLPQTNASPVFVKENKVKVTLPEIKKEQLSEVIALPMWQEFNEKCVSCGSCNTVCITCSCFDTTDIIYNETSLDGERRRIWSSCMLENFSTMAGGHSVRNTAGDRMRFKTLHKVHDYNLRFGGEDNMCVGCGRCDIRCPKDISFRDTINRLSNEMENLSNG